MKEDTVYTLFLDMIKFELNFGAYWIYLALKRGYLQKNDPAWKAPRVQFTEEEIAQIYEMDRRDVLGLNRIKLFATQVGDNKTYAFYFAHKVDEAITLHKQIYGTTPTKWHSVYNQMRHQTLHIPGTEHFRTFYEIKAAARSFPVYVGEVGFNIF